MSTNNFPIGFFDSGIGGTSIWKEVLALLPKEQTIYLSDSKNAPYGEKSKEEIIALCEKNIDFLLKRNCKLIVVACNTATTNAIAYLRKKYPIPFIGIEPAIKPAALITQTKKIGILATKGTLNSTLFEKTAGSIQKDIQIKETVGKGLVELIEGGKLYSKEMTSLLSSYLKPIAFDTVDALVLGCTHYPYLIPQIREIIGDKIKIIDSGEAVARQTSAILTTHALLNSGDCKKKPQHLLYINKDATVLESLLSATKDHTLKITKCDF
jgi:glutamate racemase